MKKALLLTLLVGWSYISIQAAVVNGVRYTLSKSDKSTVLRSIGAELDPHFHAQHVLRSAGSKAEDWDRIIAPRIRKMHLQSLRMMTLPSWYEQQNDNDDPSVMDWERFSFHSPEMQGLYKALDLAEELGIKVTLVPWGACCNSFLAPGTLGWVTGPLLFEEYCENIAALLKQLLVVKGYTCIDELTPGNEPDGWGMSPTKYVELCHALHNRLVREGLRDRIKLALVDNTDRGGQFDYISACAPLLKGIADALVSHTYIFGYGTNSSDITSWEHLNDLYAKKIGVRHFVGEFGSDQCVGSSRQRDIDDYRRGVLVVRNALALLAGGASGVSYWQLFDEYYSRGDDYAQMQQLGMWRSVKDDYATENYFPQIRCDYQPRPQYYAYTLLTRFIRPGAKLYPMIGNAVACHYPQNVALGVKNTDGTWVYVIANLSDEEMAITLKNSKDRIRGTYERYVYQENSLPADDSLLSPQMLPGFVDGCIEEVIPSNSVALYRSLPYSRRR